MQKGVAQRRTEERVRPNRGLHSHPRRLLRESDCVTARVGVCIERHGNKWEKHNFQNSWKTAAAEKYGNERLECILLVTDVPIRI